MKYAILLLAALLLTPIGCDDGDDYECENGEHECADDGRSLKMCIDYEWYVSDCVEFCHESGSDWLGCYYSDVFLIEYCICEMPR